MKKIIAAFMMSIAAMFASATTVTSNTEYVVEQWVNPVPAIHSEVHVIGVYGAIPDSSGNNHPVHTINIDFSGTNELLSNIVLSSYEPVKWVLTGNVEKIRTVLLNGYYDSQVFGLPSDTIVIDRMNDNYLAACAFTVQDYGGCNTSELLQGVSSIYNVPVTSFTGAYYAEDFSVNFGNTVPEPATAMLTMIGFLGTMGAYKLNRKNG